MSENLKNRLCEVANISMSRLSKKQTKVTHSMIHHTPPFPPEAADKNIAKMWLSILSDHKKLVWGSELGPEYFRSLSTAQIELIYTEILKGIYYVVRGLSDENVKRELSERGYHFANAEAAIFSIGSAKYEARTWLKILLGYEHAILGSFDDYCGLLRHLDRRQNLANLTAAIEQLRRETVIH